MTLTVLSFDFREQEKTFVELNESMHQGYEGTWKQLDAYLAKVQG